MIRLPPRSTLFPSTALFRSERIDISGNTRPQDRVIRREFRIAEGDAFNAAQIRRSRQRIRDLGYFSDVQVTSSPGSAPDRAVLNTQVTERATGRSEEHTSELQSRQYLVCRLLLDQYNVSG